MYRGISTFAGNISLAEKIVHTNDTNHLLTSLHLTQLVLLQVVALDYK